MAWTDERVEKLKKLWEEGKSASEIAKELGNVTRNAVIGKVHRMGLQSRVTSTAKTDTKATAKAETVAPKAEAPKKAEPKAEAKPKPKAEAKPKPAPKPIADSVVETVVEIDIEVEAEAPQNSPKATPNNENQFPAIVPVNNDEISEETRRNVERVESESKRLTLMQLTERTCKWPVGDPATDDFWFCGHPSEPGKPYCEAHVELAFQAPMARRR